MRCLYSLLHLHERIPPGYKYYNAAVNGPLSHGADAALLSAKKRAEFSPRCVRDLFFYSLQMVLIGRYMRQIARVANFEQSR